MFSPGLPEMFPEGPGCFRKTRCRTCRRVSLPQKSRGEGWMLRLHEEIPYRLTVETESWKERGDGSVMINQVVHVERESHKRMIIGQGGRVIRQVSPRSQGRNQRDAGPGCASFRPGKGSPGLVR